MTGHHCCVCGNYTKAKDPSVTFHRIPKEPEKRALWIKCFVLVEDIKESRTVCCRHFLNGNVQQEPSINVGKRFASPMKKDARSKRAK